MARTGTARSADLWLVQTGPFYRPPLPLSERPDLAAAFERGRRDRADALGRRTETWAPAPLPLSLISLTVDLVLGVWLERRRPLHRRVLAWLFAGTTVAVNAYVSLFADRWQGRRLGVDPADAPVPAGLSSRLGIRALLALAYGVWFRRRTGEWPRTGPAAMAAARVVTEVQRRRSWRAALAAGRD